MANAQPRGQLVIVAVFRIFKEQYFRVARQQPLHRLPHQLPRSSANNHASGSGVPESNSVGRQRWT